MVFLVFSFYPFWALDLIQNARINANFQRESQFSGFNGDQIRIKHSPQVWNLEKFVYVMFAVI